MSLSGFNVKALKAHLQSFYPTYLFFCVCLSFVGNTEIEIDIKRYYCKAGIKSIQVGQAAFPLVLLQTVFAEVGVHMLTRKLHHGQVQPFAVLLINVAESVPVEE